MVRDVFDNEVGIFMPKATVDYLLKEDVNAADELLIEYQSMTVQIFHAEKCAKLLLKIYRLKKNKNLSRLIHMSRNLSYNDNMK